MLLCYSESLAGARSLRPDAVRRVVRAKQPQPSGITLAVIFSGLIRLRTLPARSHRACDKQDGECRKPAVVEPTSAESRWKSPSGRNGAFQGNWALRQSDRQRQG